MRFGYVILGLVTLAFLHVSSGEHPCEMFLDTPTTLAQLQNPWGRGGDRRRSRSKLNAMARILSLGPLAGDLATTDIKARRKLFIEQLLRRVDLWL